MITFTGNPDDGSGSPVGYGPRLWIKFEDADTRTQTFRDLVAYFKTICCWEGNDRLLLSDDQESDARIMSWEFPSVRYLATDSEDPSLRWKAAIEYLRGIGAKRIEESEKVSFTKGFSQLYG